MASHPVNLAFRFLLELAALAAMAWWGWTVGIGGLRFVLAAAVPIGAAILWGLTAVPGDPSRGGRAPFATPGILRLIFELAFFTFAVWALYATGHILLAALLGAAAIIHYAISYDRIGWLLKQ